jgi:DNA ligase-1
MAERKVMLADVWNESIDPKGWLLSEKFNGRRAEFDGKWLRSSSGQVIAAPASFLQSLPPIPLDGELWLGRGEGNLQEIGSIVSRSQPDERWSKVSYLVFDLPDPAAGPFSERVRILQGVFATHRSPRVALVPYAECKSRVHFDEVFEQVVSMEGEGVMLRRPDSRYVRRRVSTLLKRKKFFDDEATVIGHQPGENGCAGMLGALVCRLDNGIEFEIGTGFSVEQRRSPPPIGSRVTFRYPERSREGRPIGSPSYQGVRPDE